MPPARASEPEVASVERSLDLIARVAVLRLIDGRERNDQLRLLDSLGFKHAEIAQMLDMKANTVSVTIARMKQQRGKATD